MLARRLASLEQKFFETRGNGLYSFEEKTLSHGGHSVNVLDVTRTDGKTTAYTEYDGKKSLVCLHFTAGHIAGDIATLTAANYSVAFVVARDGRIYRLFDEKNWAWHLAGKVGNMSAITKRSIAIEMSNLGPLSANGEKLRYYAGDYCDASESDFYESLPQPFRGYTTWATYTNAQYEALRALLGYLVSKYQIPYTFLAAETATDASPRYAMFPDHASANAYEGIASHINYRTDKFDIGPAFHWERLLDGGKPAVVAHTSVLSSPVDLGAGSAITTESAAAAYEKTETSMGAGFFPLGANTVWHGGLHLHGNEGDLVRSAADGRIVAARLGAGDAGVGHYGSINFILTRHAIRSKGAQKRFFILYMHLGNPSLDEGSPVLEAARWLGGGPKGGPKYVVQVQDLNFRSSPDASSKRNVVARLRKGETLVALDQGRAPFWKVRRESGGEGFVYFKPDWLVAAPEPTKVDDALLKKLAGGEVVALDRPVHAGDVLWPLGAYGSSGSRAHLLHWEIFSEENLFADTQRFPGWKAVEDSSQDFNMDHPAVLALVDQDQGWFESDENLTDDEIRRFYKSQNGNAVAVRRYACRFVSEWAMNLESAIPKMKGRFFTVGLEARMRPYVFWSELVARGVELPKDGYVWHYNPIAFAEDLVDPLVPDADVTPPPQPPPPAPPPRPAPTAANGWKHTPDLSDGFFSQFREMCGRLGCKPMDLLSVWMYESGVQASAHNRNGNASGLFQCMPYNLKGVGFTQVDADGAPDHAAFRRLSAEQQLPYAEKFYAPWKKWLTEPTNCYVATFLPAQLKLPPDASTVLCGKNGPYPSAYSQNTNFDVEKKGYITRGDLLAAIERATVGPRWDEIKRRMGA